MEQFFSLENVSTRDIFSNKCYSFFCLNCDGYDQLVTGFCVIEVGL